MAKETNRQKWMVVRTYECLACEGMVAFEEPAYQKFRKQCPLCHKKQLLLKEGVSNLAVFTDLNQPKTLGSLAELNTQKKITRGESIADPMRTKKPFWRKTRRINYKVLNNPNKYINTGTTQ